MIDYPAHLNDPLRIEAAATLSADILQRILPSLALVNLKDMKVWWDGTFTGTLDAWDRAYALSYSMQLTGLLDYWTTPNAELIKRDVALDSLRFFSLPEMLRSLPIQDAWSVARVRDYVHGNPRVIDMMAEELDRLPGVDESCLLVRRYKGAFGIDYGNRRVLRAVIGPENKKLEAFVCIPSSIPMKDFWVPAETLLRLVRTVKQDKATLSWVRETLKWYFAQSKVARITWERRIAPDNQEVAKLIAEGL